MSLSEKKKEELIKVIFKRLKELRSPIISESLNSYIEGAQRFSNLYGIEFELKKSKSKAKEFLKERIPTLEKTLTETTINDIEIYLTKAFEEGWYFEDFWNALKNSRTLTEKRAWRIWRTERQYALNQAIKREAEDKNIKYVKWRITPDEKTCSKCRPLSEKIFSWKDAPPLPLHPNCRCAYVPKYIRKKDIEIENKNYLVNEEFGDIHKYWRDRVKKEIEDIGIKQFKENFKKGIYYKQLKTFKTNFEQYLFNEKESINFYYTLCLAFNIKLPKLFYKKDYNALEVEKIIGELLRFRAYDLAYRNLTLHKAITLYYNIDKENKLQKELIEEIENKLTQNIKEDILELPSFSNIIGSTYSFTQKPLKDSEYTLAKEFTQNEILISSLGMDLKDKLKTIIFIPIIQKDLKYNIIKL